MNQTVEFVLKLRDMMSGGMRNVAATAQTVMAQVNNSVARTGRMAGQSIGDINRRLDELRRTRELSVDLSQIRHAGREMDRLERQRDRMEGLGRAGAGGKGGGGSMFGSMLGANLATQGLMLAGRGVMGIITQAATAEQQLIGLKTFLGEKGAQATYAQLQKDAAVTPYTTTALLGVSRSLISTGMAPDAARKDTLNLANAVSGSGGGNDELTRMAANMMQIRNLGKANAMDIRQFGQAGINIYALLGQTIYGTTQLTAAQTKKVQEMDVTYDLLSRALERGAQKGGLYYNAMVDQAKTVKGMWSTLVDNVTTGSSKVGMAVEGITKKVLQLSIDATNKLPDILQTIQPAINIAGNIADQVIGLMPAVMGLLRPIGDVLAAIPFQSIITDVVGVVHAVADSLTPVLETLKGPLSDIMGMVGNLAHLLATEVIGSLRLQAPYLLEFAKGLGDILGPAVRLVNDVISIQQQLFDGISERFGTIPGKIGGMGDALKLLVSGPLSAFGKMLGLVADLLDKVIGDAGILAKGVASTVNTIGLGAVQAYQNGGAGFTFSGNKRPAVAAGPSLGTSDLSDSSSKINGGGVRTTIINIGKLWEDLVYHVHSKDEADAQTGDKTAEGLMRLLHSAGAIAN